MICMAALAVNAFAIELKLFPEKSIENAFSGNSVCLSENIAFSAAMGDVAAAAGKLELLQRKFPETKTAWLSALVMAAGGRADEAAAVLQKIAADKNDPARLQACFYLAQDLVSKENYFSALHFFQQLDDPDVPEHLRFQGRRGVVLCLMKCGVFEQADALLAKAGKDFPGHGRYWDQMRTALLGYSGKYAELESFWKNKRKNHSPAPSDLLFDGLRAGAKAAAEGKAFEKAEFLCAESFSFAADNKARRNVLKDLAALQEKHFPERALKTIARYFRYFPKDPSAGELKLLQGAILNRLGRYAEAQDLLMKLLKDPAVSSKERAYGAVLAAFSAEKLADPGLARELYNSAIRRLGDDDRAANRVKIQLLEFFLRNKEYSSAVMLGEELEGAENVDQAALRLYRLKALMELKRYSEAAVVAGELAKFEDASYAAEGVWQSARLFELQRSFDGARELYLTFIRRFPGDHRVPSAMFSAADLAMRQGKFKESAGEFASFIEKFPDHRYVRSAILAELYSLLHQNEGRGLDKAVELLVRLEKEFSGSSEFENAAMEMAEFYFRKGNYDDALELLEKFLRMRPESGKVPEALLLEVKIFERIGNYTNAIEYADRILDKFPNTKFAVDAAMRGGSCCFQSGKYQQALKYYERAGELGGRGLIAQIAAGEAADCHLLLRKKENLASAIAIYKKLAEETEFPALQIQALYKLGLAFEYSSMNMKALETYEKLLYAAASSEKVRRSSGVGYWCARAAHSALRLILGATDMPDGSQRAQRVYQMYSHLGLPGSGNELRNYLSEIQKHYNLLD